MKVVFNSDSTMAFLDLNDSFVPSLLHSGTYLSQCLTLRRKGEKDIEASAVKISLKFVFSKAFNLHSKPCLPAEIMVIFLFVYDHLWTHLMQTLWRSDIATIISNALKLLFSSVHSSLIVIWWPVWMSWLRHFCDEAAVHGDPEHSLCFMLLLPQHHLNGWHQLFGLQKCTVSTDEYFTRTHHGSGEIKYFDLLFHKP